MNAGVAVEIGNPFPGLRPFREGEEHLFFGRESQVDTMIDKLAQTRFLAVVGTSGCGKSSLINCGLRPALRRGLMAKAGTCWRMAQFRPGGGPLQAMARALAKDGVLFTGFEPEGLTLEDIIEASLRMSRVGLADVYEQARLSEGVNLLVVVDQFEELFRYRPMEPSATSGDRSQEARAFVNLLLAAQAQAQFPIYIVLTMRSDFLGDCAEFAGLPEAINEGQYLVPRLTREERRAAIAGPVRVGGGEISPLLLTRLVNDVGDNPDQLSILQHALNRTWARWQHEGRREGSLDLTHYEAIGTMARALDQHAEKAYGELGGERQRKICEKVFKALTDKGSDPRGIRRPTKLETLCALAEASPAEATEVIEVFRKPSRSFLMPPLPEVLEPDAVIDISHESLMRVWERLRGWADAEAQSAQLYRRLSETAVLYSAGKAGLWHDPDLQLALEWREREKPTDAWAGLYGGGFEPAMSFLAESEAQRERELREKEERQKWELQQAQTLAEERRRRVEEQARAAKRLRWWLRAVAIVALLLAGALVYASRKRTAAIQAQRAAVEAQRAAEEQAKLADARTREAKAAERAARDAEVVAEQQKEAAEKSDNEMRLEALRVRDLNLNSQSTLASLEDDLLQYSSPQQSALWRLWKAGALLQQGDYEDAQALLSKALELAPDSFDARTERGYLLFLLNRPQDALKDLEYIRDHIDPLSCLNNLNLAVAYAGLGNYTAARGSLKKAMANVRHGSFEGGSDTLIPRDITRATGRTTLTADVETFEAALYYMQANLEAYVGSISGFRDALTLADERAKPLSPVSQKDAYFTAMDWAWLHLRVRCPEAAGDLGTQQHSGATCKDYGALASEAKLWEKAQYPQWAACYYQRFQDQHRRWADKRYVSLAKWVEQAKTRLGFPSSFSCQSLEEREPDVPTLEIEAREAKARKSFPEAKKLLDQALAKASEADKIRLLVQKAVVLLEYGQDERQKSRDQRAYASAAEARLEQKRKEKEAEEKHLQELAEKTSDWANTKKRLEEKYASEIAEAQKEQADAQAAAEQHEQKARAAFHALRDDCDQILKKDRRAAVAYYYRALAQDWLDTSKPSMELVLNDVGRALQLDPAYSGALRLLDDLVPDFESEEDVAYLERYHDSLDRYYRMSPFSAKAFMHKAKLANKQKRFIEALQSIETAIAMQPEDLSLYGVRAQAERGLGVNESQVKSNLADGYRQAGDILRRRGETWQADQAYQKGWQVLAELAKNQQNEETRCDSTLTTCTVTKAVEGNSEWVYSGILSVGNGGGEVREARIDKGSEDGVVVGAHGNIWSPYSKDKDGHERHIMKLGTGEVLSVEPDSALVRVTMDSPKGDGLVREHDCLQLKAHTLSHPKDSQLWALVKYNITVQDMKKNKIMDYRTLYSGETPEFDHKLLQTMLDDIHASGPLHGDVLDKQMLKGKTLSTGIFEGKTARQALESATLGDLDKALHYALKYPGSFFGGTWNAGVIYMSWVLAGTPPD